MECPRCGYVRQANDQSPENECPRCGLRISGAARSASQDDRARRLAVCEDCGGKVSRLAATCPHCGRPFDKGRVAVEVINIKMEFEAMVWFMVKAALAAIPAAIILAVLAFFFGLLLQQVGR